MIDVAETIQPDVKQELPEGWKWVRLGDVCHIVIGRTPRRDTPAYWEGSLPWVTISDLNHGVLVKTKECITELGAQESRSRVLKAGTLLFSFKLTIGKMAIAGVDLSTNEAIAGLVPRNVKDLNRDYLKFALSNIDAAASSSHAVKGKTLNQDRLEALLIPLPPLAEQQRIAKILTEQLATVEQAQVAAEAQLAAAKELPAAYLRAVFESEEARGWSRVRLGDVLMLRKDVVYPKDNPKGAATFVGLEHIESGTGIRIGKVEVEMSELTGRKPRFYMGDIVYGYLRPYLNKVWIADFDGLCSVDQYVYAPAAKKATAEFVAAYMRSPVYLERAPIDITPGQLPRIRTEEVATVEITLPSLAVQQKIVQHLEEKIGTAQQVRQALAKQLDAVNQLPAALLRRAFAGDL